MVRWIEEEVDVVSRRTGGLENGLLALRQTQLVSRRTGGLEIALPAG